MNRILHITGSDDPLVDRVKEQARDQLELVTVGGDEVPRSFDDFDALLVGDTWLNKPLNSGSETGPKFIQLTRGHHRDVDIAALTASGVTVSGATPALAQHVARHALGLALAARWDQGQRGMQERDGVTAVLEDNRSSLDGVTVGIVGFGRVGQAMANLCSSVGATVIYSDIRTASHGSTAQSGARRSTLDLLLSKSDVVSLHVQWGPTSNPVVSGRELRLMAKGSVLVNAADARLVDSDALAESLESERIRAGLDIEEPDASKLAGSPGVVVTPYVAARSSEADAAVAEFAVRNIQAALSGKAPEGVIEVIDYPRAGDPAFWSSKMSPRA